MTGQYRISYTQDAYGDLEDIYSYLAFTRREKGTASGLVRRIREEISSLRSFPERYQQVDWEPWASRGVRKVPVGNYVVYYLADAEGRTVTVLRIFYGGRDVEHIVDAATPRP